MYDSSLSDKYISLYKEHHRQFPKCYEGFSASQNKDNIRFLIRKYQSKTLLDYGCGAGLHYKERDNCFAYWNLQTIHLYDPAVPKFAKLTSLTDIDCAICTDVLEHVPKQNVPYIIKEISSRISSFVFFSISTLPAKVILSNGENAHITIENKEWWIEQILKHGRNDINYYARFSGPVNVINLRTGLVEYPND